MALQGYTRSYALPSGWQSGTEEQAMMALGSAPQWVQSSLRGVISRHFASSSAPGKKQTLSKKARTAWEQAIAQYGPEGGYGKGVEAGLKRGGTQAVASGMQSLVSSGLASTTMAAGLGKKYEEEVAAPARARVEETRAAAIANLQAGLAGAEQRGFETAEDRALRERLANLQISSQQRFSMRTPISPARKTQPSGRGGSTGFYGEEDASFGGIAQEGAGVGTELTAAGGRGPGSQVYTTNRNRPGIYDGPTAY